MSLKKLVNITPAELKAKGVVSLADRPNVTASYGTGGLSQGGRFERQAVFYA